MADPEQLSITGIYEKNHVHLVIMLQPEDEYLEDEEMESCEQTEKQLLN